MTSIHKIILSPICTIAEKSLSSWDTLKKSLFPVQQVAILVASWEAAKSFFFFLFFLCIERVGKMLGEKNKKIGKCEKNVPTRYL